MMMRSGKKRIRRKSVSPTRIIAVTFAAIILLGAVLLHRAGLAEMKLHGEAA